VKIKHYFNKFEIIFTINPRILKTHSIKQIKIEQFKNKSAKKQTNESRRLDVKLSFLNG
jgi:hypothetical protein